MKAELKETQRLTYVFVSYDNHIYSDVFKFEGNRQLAYQITELINNSCPECNGIAGKHYPSRFNKCSQG
jgi:hypothetical protein